MHKISIKARAKINISLDVVGKRDDGYHNVKMIMQTINLYDKLNIKKIKNDEIAIKTNLPFLPTDERNLVYKVIKHMKEEYTIKTGIYVELYKTIPVAAGLAGGSSDAAAALIGMNKLFDLNLSIDDLMKIGVGFGADIPYCLLRGTALAEGIGEELTLLKNFPDCYVVLAKPNINVSTAFVYSNLDLNNIKERPNTDDIIRGINNGNIKEICYNMCNVLETVTVNKYSIIGDIKEFMLSNGALGALMSGSGPTVFGIFDDKHKAYNLAYKLKTNNLAKFIYTTTIFNRKR